MAKKSRLSFTVDNVIFYESGGKLLARTKPATVKQTRATKTSAGKFGEAVDLCKGLRDGLHPLLKGQPQKEIMIRLNNALYQWTLAGKTQYGLKFLTDFRFNTQTGIRERLRWALELDWQPAGLHIPLPRMVPSQQIVAAAYTQQVVWTTMVAGINLQSLQVSTSEVITQTIPYQKTTLPAQTLFVPYKLYPGTLTVAVTAMRSLVPQKGMLKEHPAPRWQPMDIVGVVLK